jgi:hypothetical protein
MNNDDILKLYEKHGSLRKISEISGLSRYMVTKIIKGEEHVKRHKVEYTKDCLICENEFKTKYNKKTTCSDECRREYKKRYLKNLNYNYDKLILWRIEKKKKCVEYKGGCCVICGYKRCLSALEFHHLNPEEKDFSISKYVNVKFEKIKNELDKCVLLCANCHREVHDGITELNL